MAGSRPSRTGRVAASACLTHMRRYVHPADQRDLHLALLQTNDHSTVPGPVISIESPADSRKELPQIGLTMLVTRRYSFRPLNFAHEFATNSERQKILLGAPPTSRSEQGVSMHNGGSARGYPAGLASLAARS